MLRDGQELYGRRILPGSDAGAPVPLQGRRGWFRVSRRDGANAGVRRAAASQLAVRASGVQEARHDRRLVDRVIDAAWFDEMVLDVKTGRPHPLEFYGTWGVREAAYVPQPLP